MTQLPQQPPPGGQPQPAAGQYGGQPQPGAAASGPSGPRAGFWKRFLAFLVDGVLLGIVTQLLGVIFGEQPFSFDDGRVGYEAAGAFFLITQLIQIAYYVAQEGSSSGQTLGKRLLGIRVIDFGGRGAIGYPRAFIRYVGRFVSGFVCLLGYLWMLWDKEKQTWHDKFSNAVVVPVDAYPVAR